MPIKCFCDECGVEVADPSMSLDMTGKILCSKHYAEYQEISRNSQWSFNKSYVNRSKHFPYGLRKLGS